MLLTMWCGGWGQKAQDCTVKLSDWSPLRDHDRQRLPRGAHTCSWDQLCMHAAPMAYVVATGTPPIWIVVSFWGTYHVRTCDVECTVWCTYVRCAIIM